ncbi:hypothetical protein ACMD2_23961 [Ananas comosus]|uniref:Nuclear envelope integral membrane protein 1 n=1 Tax=Ananas comosus TaxID=4615 RepID=A0A199V9A7_ANACO|nr:hypothetical protein ACMD2_23961 [Ananas comosus]
MRSSPLPLLLSLLLLLFSTSSSLSSPDEFTVDSHPSKLLLPLGRLVDPSPGSRPLACARVHIRGLSRLRNPCRFAHALRVSVDVPQGDGLFRVQSVELCFHRNASIGIGMCPASQWQKLSKSSWVQSMSPYEHRILDIRMPPDPSRTIEVSTAEEFVLFRVVFLVVGMVMMATAHTLSESVVFYYGGAMTIGIILVILMILFQGMRLLPTGRKSSLAIFMYSSAVGVTTFLLSYLSGFLRSILVEIGISEDMHYPLGIIILVCIVLAGAWFGFWGVRKLVLTEEGSVDSSVAYFVEWSIMILSAVMILQSSLDVVFAIAALGFCVLITAITRNHGKSRFLRRLVRRIIKSVQRTRLHALPPKYSHEEYLNNYERPVYESPPRPRKYSGLTSCSSPILGLTRTPPQRRAEDNYFSTFHNTPERRKMSKEEWETFTKEQTKKAVDELVSSPDFNRWVVANANRISVTPPGTSSSAQRQRLFRWF